MKTLLFNLLACTCGPAPHSKDQRGERSKGYVLSLTLLLAVASPLLPFPFTPLLSAQDAKAQTLRNEMVAATGGMEALHALKDVAFTYGNYRGVSQERYIFDGEISWGKSTTKDGKTQVQYFDGERARVWIDGVETTDEEAIQSAFFSRKTNYYWLTMMQKMADPGLLLKYGGKRTYEGVEYDLLDVTFEDGVGVAKDRYVLYVNPYTKLVDLFLFNVTAVGRTEPIMMKYTYGAFPGGVMLPVVARSHSAANWEGELDPKAEWSARYRTDIRFNNGFTKETIRE